VRGQDLPRLLRRPRPPPDRRTGADR
jgi:hypothetical protein